MCLRSTPVVGMSSLFLFTKQFICSPVDGHLVCFQILAVIKSCYDHFVQSFFVDICFYVFEVNIY